jgi:hypothetical protein
LYKIHSKNEFGNGKMETALQTNYRNTRRNDQSEKTCIAGMKYLPLMPLDFWVLFRWLSTPTRRWACS